MVDSTKILKALDIAGWTLLVVGGLNWGLIAILGVDAVAAVFGAATIPSRIIYALMGISAIYEGVQWKAIQHRWGCTGFLPPSEASAGSGAR